MDGEAIFVFGEQNFHVFVRLKGAKWFRAVSGPYAGSGWEKPDRWSARN